MEVQNKIGLEAEFILRDGVGIGWRCAVCGKSK